MADLDGDGLPEITFISSVPSAITALRGSDCSVLFSKPFAVPSELAVGDLDGDKIPEIVAIDRNSKLLVLDNKGNPLATAPEAYKAIPGLSGWGAPVIADLDGTAPPELVFAGQALRFVKGNPTLTQLWNQTIMDPYFGNASIVADLDGDQLPEVIAGTTIFDGINGADKTPVALRSLGGVGAYAAVGDFNGDGKPDIVISQDYQSKLRVAIFDYANNKFIFGPYVFSQLGAGPPTVADFDGDGQPEFATISVNWFIVFDMECAVKNPPPQCDQATNIGIRWKNWIQDGSYSSGSTAFDLNGDGIPEAVFRDDCWLRAYDGKSGTTRFAINITANTDDIQLPVVADVDGDGRAEIAVSAEGDPMQDFCPHLPEAGTGAPWIGLTSGLVVLKDPFNRWMPTRPVWNEHSYHSTNVRDDLSVPIPEPPSWIGNNNYRAQPPPPKRVKLPDFTAGPAVGIDISSPDCAVKWTLRASLCNRGAIAAVAGVPGTFYSSDPRTPNAPALCSTLTKTTLAPGDCEIVSCDWSSPQMGTIDLWFRANDDGKGGAPLPECRSNNDLLHLPGASCRTIK